MVQGNVPTFVTSLRYLCVTTFQPWKNVMKLIKSLTLSSTLLLSGCTAGEATIIFWLVVTLFVGGLAYMIFEHIHRKNERNAVRSKIMNVMTKPPEKGVVQRSSVISSDILVDVKGNGGIVLDARNMQVGIVRGQGAFARPTMIPYRDVLSSEIIEDGETVTKTQRGSQVAGVLIGGLALGGIGAIIGGLSGSTKSLGKVSKIALMITINDLRDPVHYVMLLDESSALAADAAIGKTHPSYKEAMGEAQKWHGKMKVIIRQADEEDRRQEKADAENTVTVASQTSLADELKKLSELRDQGILTEDEFATQKAKILEKS